MLAEFQWLFLKLSILVLPVIFAIAYHEAAHGLAAYFCGDRTAWRAGRVSLNPARNIDPFGTIVMPLMLFLLSRGSFFFGYGKQTVDVAQLRHQRRDVAWVSLAGPAANIVLAFVSALLLYAEPIAPLVARDWLHKTLAESVRLNVLWAILNMIPLPPLDGGRVAIGLLPAGVAKPLAQLEPYGFFILFALMLLPRIGVTSGLDLNLIGHLVNRPVFWILHAIGQLTGVVL
jgi:Zn-dependent protease